MDLKHFQIFLAVADELHFGRAAERMHMAQPALSARVKALEESLGVQLFSRTTRSVALTRAGEVFLPEARAAVAQADAAVKAARSVGGSTDLLKVGGVDSATAGLLPEVIRRFRRNRPDTEVRIFEMLSAPALHALANRTLDVAFVRVPPTDGEFQFRSVSEEPIVVALPHDHPLASHKVITPTDLVAQPLVIPARSHRPILFDVIHDYLRKYGIDPHIQQEANERHMIIAMVASGMGLSLVPKWVSEFKRDDVIYLPFEDGGPTVAVNAVWRRNETMKAVADFVECTPHA